MDKTRTHIPPEADEPDLEPLSDTAQVAQGRLLLPRAIQQQYRTEDETASWYEELNALGERWIPNPSAVSPRADERAHVHLGFGKRFEQETNPARRALLEQAWMLTYTALWINGTKHFFYHQDCDTIINGAMGYLMTDLINYDPTKSRLGDMISAQIKNRLNDYKRNLNSPRNYGDFEGQIRDFQNTWPSEPEALEKHITAVINHLFVFYRKQVERKLNSAEKKNREKEFLRSQLRRFDPTDKEQPLITLIRQWVDDNLDGDPADPIIFSADASRDEEDPNSPLIQIPDPKSATEAIEAKQMTDTALERMALALNFKAAQNPNCLTDEEYRNTRMCYTEKIVYMIRHQATPDFNRQDMNRALLEHYLRFFLDVPAGDASVDLKKAPLKTREQIENPQSEKESWLTPIDWSHTQYLPAYVPIHYLHQTYGQKITNKKVTNMRDTFAAQLKICLESFSGKG